MIVSIALPRSIVLTVCSLISTSLPAQQPQTPPRRPANVQQYLDTLARPGKFTNTTPALPDHYADWTEDQRRIGMRQVAGRCNVLWVMMNDAGPANLLPSGQNPADSQKLATETCIAAHMPTDWNGRPNAIADIRRILTRSTELGQPLTLPPFLAR